MLTIRNTQVQQMAQALPGRQMIQPCDDTKTWVEIRLIDQDDVPVPAERYQIKLSDGSLMEGDLDSEGKVRFDFIIPGNCQVCFPDIHASEWQLG